MRDWNEIDAELINKFVAKYHKYVHNNFTTKQAK